MQCVLLQDFLSLVENANVILSKRQRCERCNFRKIEIFNHNFKNEKVPKQDEFGILG